MRIAHIVPARDKAEQVAKTVHSVLNQTYPCHVVLSDQGSTDDTLKIIRELALSYRGPHKVSVLSCPDTGPKGMRGMNAHLDWIMGQIDEDVILITSADDIALQDRTAQVVRAFQAHRPDMVLTALHFMEPDGTHYGVTAGDLPDGFVEPIKCLQGRIGGSTAHAWTRDFYEAVGSFEGISGFDAFWPFLATMRNGAYYLADQQHIYVRHCDPNNTGLEGMQRAADENGKLAVEELMHFQVQAAYIKAANILERWQCKNEEVRVALYNEILDRAVGWSNARTQMSLRGIQPMLLKT